MKLVFSLVCCFSIAQSSTASGQPIDLLAGDLLSQWVAADGSGFSGSNWTVAGGVLHLKPGGRDIFLDQSVGNFVLDWEFMISPGGNSGIKYRVAKYGNSWLGCEYQIQDDPPNAQPRHTTGSLYEVYEPITGSTSRPAGQWNRARIVVCGNQVEHWLNGILVVLANAGDYEWLDRVSKSKFKPHVGWGQNPTGRLMLQDHGSEVWFRNVYLTEFQAPYATSVAQQVFETGRPQSRLRNALSRPLRVLGRRH